MADIVDAAKRSKMMSGIRSKNTKPEMLVRRGIHALGFRYKLHDKKLPGKPDLVFPKYKAVLFVHGCFWHGHNCRLFKMPSSNTEFWCKKITKNRQNDAIAMIRLKEQGWRCGVVWECAMKGKDRSKTVEFFDTLNSWLRDGARELIIGGSFEPEV